ncbi:hypothetical protein JCM5353_003783 [Sporobolomyces roseus]
MSPSTRFKPLFLSLFLATFSSALSLPHTSHTPHPAFGRGSYGLSTDYSTIASSDTPVEADLLPQPQPSDYQLLTQQELSSLFDILSDNDGISESWHGHRLKKRALGKGWNGITSLKKAGLSGVAAMQVSVVDDDHILIYDKAEDNKLQIHGHSAWGAIYEISTRKIRPLDLNTNSFCAGGGWLSNGTLVSVGGNPQQTQMNTAAGDGLAALRLFTPCSNNKCDVGEWPERVRLTSPRWYASTSRLTDGSIIIVGGSTDNPTIEYFPPKGDGLPIYSSFLHDALNSNLFPILFTLPNGHIFVAANRLAMIYDWKNNVQYRLPTFPNRQVVTYPSSAASALLPLTIANKWTPEVVFCGGTTANLKLKPWKLSSKIPAVKQCSRMVLNAAGIKGGWKTETMPDKGRSMGDFIMTPDGKLVLVNGGSQGFAGYGNVKDEVGASNARAPVLKALLYDPDGQSGKRFSSKGIQSSNIERLYHSSATLLPSGAIWISGSNPNDQVSKTTYRTRYEVEILSPPYMSMRRPTYSKGFSRLNYGKTSKLSVSVPPGTKRVRCVVLDLGYSTHSVHNQRLVELKSSWNGGSSLQIVGPVTTGLYPPGYAWLFILANEVPSEGKRIMIGTGGGPPVSQFAIENMLKKTAGSPPLPR